MLATGRTAVEVQALRRALADPDLASIAPHVTLVPPVRLSPVELPAALAVLHEAARNRSPFTVGLGAPATFAPVSATVHLPVQDDAGQLAELRRLVFVPPLQRQTHPFVGHLTLLASATPAQIDGACTLLAGYRSTLQVGRITMLVLRHDPRRWVPLADVDLDGVRVVGSGPMALALASGTVIDPDGQALIQAGAAPGPPVPSGGDRPLVVTARRDGVVVGVAWGSEEDHEPHGIVVAPAARREGIGTQLRREFRFRSARRTGERSSRSSSAVASPGATVGGGER